MSYLLAALGSHYAANRDYLVGTLRTCADRVPNCDEDTAGFLAQLYRQGHREVLYSLVIAGLTSDGALSESLGSLYEEVLTKAPADFVASLRRLDASHQEAACHLAGGSDGGGMPPRTMLQVRQTLKQIGDNVAMRCLRQIENGSRDAAENNP